MILVTGISGGLGNLIFRGLSKEDGLDVVGGTRSGDGVSARRIDFDDPASLAGGFRGVDVLVFVSAGYAEDDVVLARHDAVVNAAEAVGVRHVVYTSLAGSGDPMTIALPHRWTEARLAEAPFEVTILRNGLYAEIPVGVAVASAASAAERPASSPPRSARDGRPSWRGRTWPTWRSGWRRRSSTTSSQAAAAATRAGRTSWKASRRSAAGTSPRR
ncbi:NAD(P)H-binding protein [Nonomuraea longispora]|uniref:NAD(P)H-binding protein n=1 Tax=Nonomuraea longispora TaxID=1848320 RepID=UPI001FE7F328|nr:NAD(P)H-binding protein [Nonomuraea longispora]